MVGAGANCIAGVTGYLWYGLVPAMLAMGLFGSPLLLATIRLGQTRAGNSLSEAAP
jgi:hypothetical protein